MREHKADQPGPDEPEDGWVVAPALYDTELVALSLCRFTGARPMQGACPDRVLGRHQDQECLRTYVAQDLAGAVPLSELQALPEELRRPLAWPGRD